MIDHKHYLSEKYWLGQQIIGCADAKGKSIAFLRLYPGEPVPDINPVMNMIPTGFQPGAEPIDLVSLSVMRLGFVTAPTGFSVTVFFSM